MIAEIFATIAAILLIISLAGPEWAQARFRLSEEQETWDWGLWVHCNTVLDERSVCMEEGTYIVQQ